MINDIYCLLYNPTRQTFAYYTIKEISKRNRLLYFDGYNPVLAEVVIDFDTDEEKLRNRNLELTKLCPDSPPLNEL